MLLNSISDFQKQVGNKTSLSSLALVPTMGALHDGHLSLIEKALNECDLVVVSIFVNPTQFNNLDDLSRYPRTLEKDLEKIDELEKEIFVYAPSVDEIYPQGVNSEKFDFGSLSTHMEGEFREGHFNGVGTVLKTLFDLIQPDKAYFGEKDFQQLAVIKKLVQFTGQNVEIIGCETYREPNGLAKSSRNTLLSHQEKLEAGIIFENLKRIKDQLNIMPIPDIKKLVKSSFKVSKNFKLEYCEIAAENDLIPINKIEPNKKYRAFIAAYCNNVRLIDNMALN